MPLILLSWLLLIFVGIKYNKEKNPIPLDIDTTLALKGISAIEIMLGHIGKNTGSIILFPNRKAGILFVGIFFALSGYGLMYSIDNKKNYQNVFLKQRIIKIVLPAYLIYILRTVLLQEPLSYIVNIRIFFEETNWYVWEILVLYTIFYLFAKISLKNISITLFFFSIVFVVIAYILKIDIPWYGSTLCFPLGIYYYLYNDKIYKYYVTTNQYMRVIFVSSIALFIGISTFFMLGESFIGYVVARNIASTSFVILAFFLLYSFRIENKISKWLGKYSYEIFLIHFVYLKVFKAINNPFMYALIVIMTTIASAYLFATFYKAIQKKLI